MVDYIEEAHVTVSPSYHGANVSKKYFAEVLTDTITVLQALDKIKKALFYGRKLDYKYQTSSEFNEFPDENCFELNTCNLSDDEQAGLNILHAVIGVATEAGELLEALFNSVVSDNQLDHVNVREEIGDVLWYQAVLCRGVGTDFATEQRRNIAKLRHRFPDRFTEFDANNRNLFIERAVLEKNAKLSFTA